MNCNCYALTSSNSRPAIKPITRILIRGYHIQGRDHGRRGTSPASTLHLLHSVRIPGEEGFHGPVPPVSDPPLDTQFPGVLDCPIPIEDALHTALDHNPHLQLQNHTKPTSKFIIVWVFDPSIWGGMKDLNKEKENPIRMRC